MKNMFAISIISSTTFNQITVMNRDTELATMNGDAYTEKTLRAMVTMANIQELEEHDMIRMARCIDFSQSPVKKKPR